MAGKGSVGPLLLLLFLLPHAVLSVSEADTLLQFKSSLSSNGGNEALRTWTQGSNPCNGNTSNWGAGVICYEGYVFGLQLERMGLTGSLILDPLVSLQGLRTISFMGNNFVGAIPDLGKLGALKSVYLSDNQFSGEIPEDTFSGMRSLKKVYLSGNDFAGKIPSSLTNLHKLLEVRLDGNQFNGIIPDLRQSGLSLFNVSYNNLEGKIPDSFSKMDASMFLGNEDLCGPPLDVECEVESPTSLPRPKRRLTALWIAIIVILVVVILAIIILFVLKSRQHTVKEEQHVHASVVKSKDVDMVVVDKLEQGTVSFVRESTERFELQDLLKASAEVLGSGNFGSSYKAVLLNGPSVVVKRFKEMNGVAREDFMEHMRRLGRLSHPNLLPLVAYYSTKSSLF